MERKYAAAGAVVAVAVLLPLGRWVIASRQDAADQQASRAVERQFVSQRAAAGVAQQTTSSPWGQGGQWGRGGQNGQRRLRSGQNGQRGQGRARMMEQMAKEVGLDQTQMKKIQAVQESSRSMMGDIFRNPQFTREQKMATMQQLRQAQQTQINKFLTPDQQAKFAAFQEKMRAQRQARRRANGGGVSGPWGGGPAGSNGGPEGGQS